MTDRYPPFRLDQGGEEPEPPEGGGRPAVSAPAGDGEGAPKAAGGGAGRVALIIVGSIAALLAATLLIGGGGALVVDRTQRDDDGFLMSPTEDFSSRAYAIVSESADVEIDGPDWVVEDVLGTVRIRSESERPVFVGIGRESDVARYLARVGRSVVTEIDEEPRYSERPGGPPANAPGDETFWVASASGAGEQTLDWEPEDGRWNAVAMNTDGSRDVSTELSIGAEADALPWIAVGMLIVGALLAVVAALAITLGIRRGSRGP